MGPRFLVGRPKWHGSLKSGASGAAGDLVGVPAHGLKISNGPAGESSKFLWVFGP